jgi:gluconolactonase
MSGIYEVHDQRFRLLTVGSARLDELATGCRWAEGPVWFEDANQLLWSDIPNNRIMRWVPGGGASVFREGSNNANGHTRDREGRLVSCEHRTRRVTRTEVDGAITVIADSFRGRRLNSPNDVVVASDGAVWFTDPTYGILSDYEGFRAEPEQDARGVYRVDPGTGAVERMADDFVMPNGLAFSPDESRLYVADSGGSHWEEAPRHIRAFGVGGDGTLSGGGVFAEIGVGHPDGLRVDTEGNVWTSAADGIHVLTPEGRMLGKVLVPQVVANLTFGGSRRNRLFIAATTSVYGLYVAATGVQRP